MLATVTPIGLCQLFSLQEVVKAELLCRGDPAIALLTSKHLFVYL